jgi:hypothetical protein
VLDVIIEHLRDLTPQRHTHMPGCKHVSAASGLVCARGRACVKTSSRWCGLRLAGGCLVSDASPAMA